MAKRLLQVMVVVGFLISILFQIGGMEVELFTKILIWSGVGVLAICESIEKTKS